MFQISTIRKTQLLTVLLIFSCCVATYGQDTYVKDQFIEGVENNLVRMDYDGKNAGLMRDITIADARWIGDLLARLSDQQLQDAFRAANYT